MCILLYVKLIWCSGIPYIYGQLEEGGLGICALMLYHDPTYVQCSGIPEIYGWLEEGILGMSALSICAFCYMLNWFSVVVLHRSMVNWRRGPWYMCILLYVKLIRCSGIPYIYGQLGGLGICAFYYMLNLCGVVVFHISMVDCRGYIHPMYMCILLYVKLMCCSGIPEIFGGLERGYICPKYMCILLYVELIWCSRIP